MQAMAKQKLLIPFSFYLNEVEKKTQKLAHICAEREISMDCKAISFNCPANITPSYLVYSFDLFFIQKPQLESQYQKLETNQRTHTHTWMRRARSGPELCWCEQDTRIVCSFHRQTYEKQKNEERERKIQIAPTLFTVVVNNVFRNRSMNSFWVHSTHICGCCVSLPHTHERISFISVYSSLSLAVIAIVLSFCFDSYQQQQQ